MTLLAPNAIWLLLLLPPLILLYFLKLRRPKFVVASTLLWRRLLDDMRVNTPFQRLRRTLLLLVQLMILAGLVIAAARPLQQLATEPEESVLVLLDCSASMQAKSGGTTRFSLARRALSKLVDELGPRSEMAIATFSHEARIAAVFTSDRRKLGGTIAELQPADASGSTAAALELAASLIVARPQARIIMISDAHPASAGSTLPFQLEFIRVGDPVGNNAITGIDARRQLDNPALVELQVTVRRFGQAPSSLLTISAPPLARTSQLVQFGSLDTATVLLQLSLPQAAVIEAKLETDDALAADNVAWVTAPMPRPFRVAMIGDSERLRFYHAALKAIPQATAVTVTDVDGLRDLSPPADAVIREVTQLPPEPPAFNEMLLLTGNQHPLPKNAVIDWQTNEPLCRFLDLAELRVREAAAVTLPDSYRPLISAGNASLVAELRGRQFHRTVVTFPAASSNWPLQAAFPLFLHNWTMHLQRLTPSASDNQGRVGERRPAGSAPSGTSISVKGPSPNARGTIVGGRVYVSGLDQAGLYSVTVGEDAPQLYAVNLTDADESDTMKQQQLLAATAPPISTIPPKSPASREWTTALLALVFAVLVGEWLLYHRCWHQLLPAHLQGTSR